MRDFLMLPVRLMWGLGWVLVILCYGTTCIAVGLFFALVCMGLGVLLAILLPFAYIIWLARGAPTDLEDDAKFH